MHVPLAGAIGLARGLPLHRATAQVDIFLLAAQSDLKSDRIEYKHL